MAIECYFARLQKLEFIPSPGHDVYFEHEDGYVKFSVHNKKVRLEYFKRQC